MNLLFLGMLLHTMGQQLALMEIISLNNPIHYCLLPQLI